MKMKRYDEGGKKSDQKGWGLGSDFNPNDPMGIKEGYENKAEAQKKKQAWLDSLAEDDPRRPENKKFPNIALGQIPQGWSLPKGDGPFNIQKPGTWSLKDLRPNPRLQAMYDQMGYTPNPYLSSIQAPWEGQSAGWKRMVANMRGEEYDYYDPAFYETSNEGLPFHPSFNPTMPGSHPFGNRKKANKGMKMKKRYTQGGRF